MNDVPKKADVSVALDFGCVTGRFQPPHEGHLELIRIALSRHDVVLLAMTNPDPTTRAENAYSPKRHLVEANPFTYWERSFLLRTLMAAEGIPRERFEIVPFPLHAADICVQYAPLFAVQYVRIYSEWERHKAELLRDYGYRVVLIEPALPKQRSGTEIRAAMVAGKQWREMLPPASVVLLQSFFREKPIKERLGS